MIKRNKYIIKLFISLTIILLSTFSISFAQKQLQPEQQPKPIKGKVIKILSEEVKENQGLGNNTKMTFQNIKVEIKSGRHKGENIIVENIIDETFAYNIIVEQGDRVLLHLEEDEDGSIIAGYISDIERDRYLMYLTVSFILLLIIIGGLKGLKSVITLTITAFAVVKILIPMILKGYNPIILSILICIGIIVITLFIVSGINKKTISSIIGTSGGVLVAGIITLIVGSASNLTGLGNEEAQMLMFIPQGTDFDFRGILFAGIIIGALGAVMDVSMSISSAMSEVESVNPSISTKDLIKSGMNVGKDIMGTMSNTLILAYTGGAIQLMILFLAYDISFVEIINRDMIASEVLRALAGSIGLILSIPLTAIVAGTIGREKI